MKATSRRHETDSWIKTHKHKLLIVSGALVLSIIAVQLAYPQDRALPLARVNDELISYQHRDDIAARLQRDFEASKVRLKARAAVSEQSLASFGATANSELMSRSVVDYPLWQRLIPLSVLIKQPSVNELSVYYLDAKLQEQANELATIMSRLPENARLTLDDGIVAALPAKNGHQVTAAAIVEAMTGAQLSLDGATTIQVPSSEQQAKRTGDDIEAVRAEAEQLVDKKITITVLDKTFAPQAAKIASWLILSENDNSMIDLAIDDNKITEYVESINSEIKIEAGRTEVELEDGKEIGRTIGADGRRLNSGQLTAALRAGLESSDVTITASGVVEAVAPVIAYSSGFTATQQGLQAYADELARTKNVRISVVQLGGERWAANARATESTVSASTYKLFVALMLFDQIDKGNISLSDAMLDTNVSGCLERMIVPSTNPCAEKFIALFGGRDAVNAFIYGKGFSRATTFSHNIATHTSASDLTRFLIGLQSGTLISGEHRAILLEKMGRQLYRAGIPAGSQGRVHDKVGFLWDYIHDTAIVHHPRGTYVVAIMTQGGSYGRIAEITRDIERIMYP